jgi:hypothetical protein
MHARLARLAAALALGAVLAAPAVAAAVDPAPIAPSDDVQAWQAHLAMMQTMGPNLGAHLRECIEMHGSPAGQLGPNGSMLDMMGSMMGGTTR